MRIAIAHESIDTRGGVETYLSAVVSALQSRGHEVLFLHHCRARGPAALDAGPATVCVEDEGLEAALDRIRVWGPDVCFSHNMGPLSTERRLLDEWPVVKMMHGYFGTCISGLKTHAFPSACACARTFGAACLAVYGPRRCGQLSVPRMIEGYRWAKTQRSLFDRYAAVVVASRHMEEEYVRNGIPRARIATAPLFSTLGPPRDSSRAEADTVLFAGRMTRLKGGDVLIAAAAGAARQLGRPIRVIMAGDGPQRGEWESLAARLGVPAEFTGWVHARDRQAQFGRASVVAVPSLWPEPFGLIGLEAASLGIPAIAFDAGGIREWLEPDRSGILVDPSSGVDGLASAIAAFFRDGATRVTLGAGARAVATRMTLDAHVDRLDGVFNTSVGVTRLETRGSGLREGQSNRHEGQPSAVGLARTTSINSRKLKADS